MKTRFLSISIFYNNTYRNCAAGAKSETFETGFLLVPDGNHKPEDIKEHYPDKPIYKLFEKQIGHTLYYSVREIDIDGNWIKKQANGPMFGGNFISSSDSRFPFHYPLPIHDRFEGW
jgi:hypothetical protein